MKIGKIILLALLLLLIGHPAFGQSITMVTLGDSLTEGAGDDGIGGGYPARLLSMLQSLYPGSTLSNLGISGDTSDDLINKQLEPAVSLLNAAPAGNLKIALVWIGSNDLFGLYEWVCESEYGNNYPACEGATFGYYSDNITNILVSLKATGSQIYIALLDDQSRRPVMTDPALRTDSFPSITDVDVSRMSAQILIYNDEITRLSSTNDATTVDFFNTTIFENWATLSDDGNHPNGAGYDAIATIWYQAISGSYASNLYVSANGGCSDKIPCYDSIQNAINDASTGSVILVKQGTYAESLSLGSNKALLIKGGYNDAYDQQTANTTFIEASGPTSINASSGSLKFQMINIK